MGADQAISHIAQHGISVPLNRHCTSHGSNREVTARCRVATAWRLIDNPIGPE